LGSIYNKKYLTCNVNKSNNIKNNTLPIGRLLRAALGLFFLTEVVPVFLEVTTEGAYIRLGWALGLLVFYLILHYIILNFALKINSFTGAVLSFGPFLAVFYIGYGGPAATGALTFLAISLIIAAIRSDSGCEVMSIPSVISGKHTHLCCLLFSPIDWFEKNLKND
jgi:hypothetical protein